MHSSLEAAHARPLAHVTPQDLTSWPNQELGRPQRLGLRVVVTVRVTPALLARRFLKDSHPQESFVHYYHQQAGLCTQRQLLQLAMGLEPRRLSIPPRLFQLRSIPPRLFQLLMGRTPSWLGTH